MRFDAVAELGEKVGDPVLAPDAKVLVTPMAGDGRERGVIIALGRRELAILPHLLRTTHKSRPKLVDAGMTGFLP